jgi:Uma2 family endonuclease
VLLVVEVADTSLVFDRTRKLRIYARAGIREYWIVDVAGDRLEVHRAPTADGYAERRPLSPDATAAPLAFPDLVIRVADIFA